MLRCPSDAESLHSHLGDLESRQRTLKLQVCAQPPWIKAISDLKSCPWNVDQEFHRYIFENHPNGLVGSQRKPAGPGLSVQLSISSFYIHRSSNSFPLRNHACHLPFSNALLRKLQSDA